MPAKHVFRGLLVLLVSVPALLAPVPAAAEAPLLPPTGEQLERIAVVAELFGSADAALAARTVVSQVPLAPVPAESASGEVVVLAEGEDLDFAAPPSTLPLASSSRISGLPGPGDVELLADRPTFCPLPGGSFWDDFGTARSGGRRAHRGIDFGAPKGAPIYAVVDGFVRFVDLQDDYVPGSDGEDRQGIALEYVSLGGDVWFIGHLDAVEPGVVPGARVFAGQRIATNGQTGNAKDSVPHLHIEVHPGGGPAVNPYEALVAVCR